jgi:hypothetical protein
VLIVLLNFFGRAGASRPSGLVNFDGAASKAQL